jgi:iron-sulfur cluster repair protein YtfE (RIC family)
LQRSPDEYTPPADACNTYKVAFAMLQDFENDLTSIFILKIIFFSQKPFNWKKNLLLNLKN